jgi:hypothetical protein
MFLRPSVIGVVDIVWTMRTLRFARRACVKAHSRNNNG